MSPPEAARKREESPRSPSDATVPVASDSASACFVVAVCAIVFRGDEMLAMRRSPSKDAGPGLWEAVSGRVEPGEEPVDAALREVAEETGLAVRLDLRPVTAYHALRLGKPMIVIVFRAEHTSGEVELSDEHDAFAWLTPDAFAERSSLDQLVAAARAAAHLR